MRDPRTWTGSSSFTEIKEYYDEQISALHEKEQSLRDLESSASGPLKGSIRKEIISTHNRLERLMKDRDSDRVKNALINSLEKDKPFYSSKGQGAISKIGNSIADMGRKLWYNDSDISVLDFRRLIQNYNIVEYGIETPLMDLMIKKATVSSAAADHYSSNREALEKHKTGQSKAFNSKGYIIDQHKMEDVKYAGFNTKDNGCGWIAAFNALKMLGNNPDPLEILTDMEPGALAFGRFGTDPFFIADYFSSQGYKVEIHTSKDKVEKAAREADANIWVYLYAGKDKDSGVTKPGGHYVAFNYDSDKKQFRFYNGTPKDGYADIASQCFPNDILRFSISIYKP